MTLATPYSKSGPYDGDDPGDGSSTTISYSYQFKILYADDLKVILTDINGDEMKLDLDDDYRITGVGNNNGGMVFYPMDADESDTRLGLGEKLTLYREVPLTQLTDITTGGRFDPRVHEDTFDLETMGLQQLNEQLSRAFLLNISDDSDTSMIFPPPEPSRVIGWTPEADALQNYDLPGVTDISLEQIDTVGAVLNDVIHFDGTELAYTNSITLSNLTAGTANVTGNLDVNGTITAGSGDVALTGADGKILGAAFESAIAGAGLSLSAGGVLSTTGGGGAGDVSGPGSATANAVAVFDGTTGKAIKEDTVTLNNGAITGVTALTASMQLHVLGTMPQLTLSETDGTTDNKHWAILANAERLHFYVYNDAISATQNWLQVDRTDTTIDAVTIPEGGLGIHQESPQYMLHVGSGTVDTPEWLGGADGIVVAETGDVKITVQGTSAAGINLIAMDSDANERLGQLESDAGHLVLRRVNDATPLSNFDLVKMDMGSGDVRFPNGNPIVTNSTTPASSGAAGEKGTLAWDANYLYICTATNTWSRVSHSW